MDVVLSGRRALKDTEDPSSTAGDGCNLSTLQLLDGAYRTIKCHKMYMGHASIVSSKLSRTVMLFHKCTKYFRTYVLDIKITVKPQELTFKIFILYDFVLPEIKDL